MNAGLQLRAVRESLGLTIRDVETATEALSQKYSNDDYYIPLSRLSDIETKGVVPSIYRLYALSVMYHRELQELLDMYGIDLSQVAADQALVSRAKTHRFNLQMSDRKVFLPAQMDPGFDIKRTTNFGRMIERWGVVPLTFLSRFAKDNYTYGYIGAEDFTMYPILLPGSFVQVDESRNKVAEGTWRSEYERPIYFIETREGYTCCWCTVKNMQLVLQPHPLSPVAPRILRDQREAEVLGQIVGIAMRLDEWSQPRNVNNSEAQGEIN